MGCGRDIRDGWINIDKYPVDERVVCMDFNLLPLQFKSDSVDEILLSHVLEHIIDPFYFIMECHRILKKDGVLRVVLPSGMMANLAHRSMGHGKDYFYSVVREYGTNVQGGTFFSVCDVSGRRRFTILEFFYKRFQMFRDWFYRLCFDEYVYVLKKR